MSGGLIRNFEYQLAANQRLSIERMGSIVRCTSAQASFHVSPDDLEKVELAAGLGIRYARIFTKFVLYNGPDAQTVELYIGDGDVADSRFYGSINALITPGASVVTPVHVAVGIGATSNIAANLSRRAITVGLLSTATDSIMVGEAGNTDAAHGVEIQPGTNFRFENTDALDVFNGTAAIQTYWTLEEA